MEHIHHVNYEITQIKEGGVKCCLHTDLKGGNYLSNIAW